ncbi:MAG: cell division protein FtsL [Terriglobales bacterium]
MAASTVQFVGASRRAWPGTPEIYFPQAIDNSRVVKVADGERRREMAHFSIALVVLFVFVMLYAWQHFSAIEYGYKIEAARTQRDTLAENNRELRLEMASLRDPERIDALARRMGLETPQVGQVVRMDPTERDLGGPVMARNSAADVAVISNP